MDINQLLSDLATLAGILLVAVLAVGPLWLSHAAQRASSPQQPSHALSHTSPAATRSSRAVPTNLKTVGRDLGLNTLVP